MTSDQHPAPFPSPSPSPSPLPVPQPARGATSAIQHTSSNHVCRSHKADGSMARCSGGLSVGRGRVEGERPSEELATGQDDPMQGPVTRTRQHHLMEMKCTTKIVVRNALQSCLSHGMVVHRPDTGRASVSRYDFTVTQTHHHIRELWTGHSRAGRKGVILMQRYIFIIFGEGGTLRGARGLRSARTATCHRGSMARVAGPARGRGEGVGPGPHRRALRAHGV